MPPTHRQAVVGQLPCGTWAWREPGGPPAAPAHVHAQRCGARLKARRGWRTFARVGPDLLFVLRIHF